MRIVSLLFMILLTLNACNHSGDRSDDAYLKEINKWKKKRLERLKSESGWLNLAGLFWLEEGVNTIGSDSSNSIIFPDKAPPRLGKYILENRQLRFIPEPGTEIRLNGKPLEELVIITDRTGKPSLLETGSLAWFIIERGDQFGIRLRDYEHPAINELRHIECFFYKEELLLVLEDLIEKDFSKVSINVHKGLPEEKELREKIVEDMKDRESSRERLKKHYKEKLSKKNKE